MSGLGLFSSLFGNTAPVLTLNTSAKPAAVVAHTKADLEALKARIEGDFADEESLKSELLAVLNELLAEDKIKDPSSGLVIGLKTYKNTLEKGYQLYEIKSSLLGDLDKMIEAASQAGGRRKRKRRNTKNRKMNKKRRTSRK